MHAKSSLKSVNFRPVNKVLRFYVIYLIIFHMILDQIPWLLVYCRKFYEVQGKFLCCMSCTTRVFSLFKLKAFLKPFTIKPTWTYRLAIIL